MASCILSSETLWFESSQPFGLHFTHSAWHAADLRHMACLLAFQAKFPHFSFLQPALSSSARLPGCGVEGAQELRWTWMKFCLFFDQHRSYRHHKHPFQSANTLFLAKHVGFIRSLWQAASYLVKPYGLNHLSPLAYISLTARGTLRILDIWHVSWHSKPNFHIFHFCSQRSPQAHGCLPRSLSRRLTFGSKKKSFWHQVGPPI